MSPYTMTPQERVAYCGQLDTSTVAPLLKRGEGDVLALRPYSP